jgi:hypothetical protein
MNSPLPNQFLTAMDCRPHGLNLVAFQRTNAEGYAIATATFEDGQCTRALYANPDDSAAFIQECRAALNPSQP